MESGEHNPGKRWGQTDVASDTLLTGAVIWVIYVGVYGLSLLTCEMGRHLPLCTLGLEIHVKSGGGLMKQPLQ